MRSLNWVTLTGCLFSGCLFLALAGNISAEMVTQPAKIKNYSVELPGRGMSKEKVGKRFGFPIERSDAVGKPPISKWRYDLFTVYFESDYVIHAVVNSIE